MTKLVTRYLLIAVMAVGCSTSGVRSVFIPEKESSDTKPASASESEFKPVEETRPEREPLIASTQQHDSATKMLIETELKDLPQEERAEWVSYLSSVDTKMVPYILKARRLRESPPSDAPSPMAVAQQKAPAGHSAAPSGKPPSIQPGPSPTQEAGGPVKTVSTDPEVKDDKSWPGPLKSLTDWDNNYFWPKKKQADQGHSLAIQADQVAPVDEKEVVKQTRFEVEPEVQSVDQLENVRISPGAELWEDELAKLIVLIENSTSSQAGDAASQQVMREQIALRLLYLIVNEPALAQQPISGMSSTQQEFWTAIFLSLAEHLDESSTSDPATRATESISQLRTAVHHLQQTARLELRNTTFCQRINSFGNYEQFDTDVFTPGQPVLIYTEIRNFVSEPTPDGQYRTALRSEVQVYQGEDGEPIDRTEFPATEDVCRTRRTDYYHSYRVTLPDSLTSGVYTLKLTVQDEFSGKLASQLVQFSIR